LKEAYSLQDLRDKTDANEETKTDLTAGIEAANRVLTQANAAVDRELRNEALEDLCIRVDDWKNHRVDQFGDLLLHGHFPVVTGKSDVQKEVRPHSTLIRNDSIRNITTTVGSKAKALLSTFSPSNLMFAFDDTGNSQWDVVSENGSEETFVDQRHESPEEDLDYFLANMTFHHFIGSHPITGHPFLAEQYANSLGVGCPFYQQYTIYLFERILLCCKEVNPNKSKDKLMGTQKDKKDKKDKNKTKEPNKNAKLQLKGRIFMTNVTEVLSLAKQGNSGNSSTASLFHNLFTIIQVPIQSKSSGKAIQESRTSSSDFRMRKL
jgi:cell division control protein 24